MLGAEQSPAAGASELDAPLNVPGVETVEEMRSWARSAEAIHSRVRNESMVRARFAKVVNELLLV